MSTEGVAPRPSAAWTAADAVRLRQVGVPVYVVLSDERAGVGAAGPDDAAPDVDELRRAAELLAAAAYEEFGVPYDPDRATLHP